MDLYNIRTIWQCNAKFKGNKTCRSVHLYEDDIKRLFIRALSELLCDRTALIEDCRLLYDTLINTADIEKEAQSFLEEIDSVAVLVKALMADTSLSSKEYSERYDSYTDRFNKAQEECQRLQALKDARLTKASAINAFMISLKENPTLPFSFDEKLWSATIEKVVVYDNGNLTFHFKNGAEITKSL